MDTDSDNHLTGPIDQVADRQSFDPSLQVTWPMCSFAKFPVPVWWEELVWTKFFLDKLLRFEKNENVSH